MDLVGYIDLHLVYLVIFSIGLSFGAGAALLSNLLFVSSIRDRRVSVDEYRVLERSRQTVWFSLLLYGFAGVGLFTLSADAMLGLGIFYADMVITALLVGNALLFQYYYLPQVKGRIDHDFPDIGNESESSNLNAHLVVSETISVVSWVFLILHHAMYRLPVDFSVVMAVYCVVLLVVGAIFYSTVRHVFTYKNVLFLKRAAVVTGVIALCFAAFAYSNISPLADTLSKTSNGGDEQANMKADAEDNTTYTLDEVAQHDNIEDCWVAIDTKVYDVTPAAEKFPDVYNCGNDSTASYREVREEGVSERVRSYEIGKLGFTQDEIQSHDTSDDCWLVIDGLVFDATEEATLHPAAFNCGGDSSENYHRNHGDGISDRMMKSHIGYVDDGVKSMHSGNPVDKKESLKPYRELYVDEGTWEVDELMAVVEKEAEKLLFIDGRTHEKIGRIHDIGFQPHTSVFSPDHRYMYIIARNGWLTKIDLNTLEPLDSINVGESSRGTALTENGKYLAVGNYIPGNIVMIDARSMEVLKTIPTVGEIDGKEVESRVGAMVEYEETIIAALKDLNSVWVIDTEQDGFPVIQEHWNIGSNETPLHDAFLSADGEYYIVASMGSNTAWVMRTDTWEEVAEIETGETPHTGPGATWGNKIYVPALGEGLITVIDMETWEPLSYIETGGPGLFIRSFYEDPQYPYVWADTAFGENKDEIYVIDARTDTIVKTIRPVEGESSWHPEFTNNGDFVYIVSQSANEVEVYDADSLELVTRIEANTPSAVSNVGNRIEELGL